MGPFGAANPTFPVLPTRQDARRANVRAGIAPGRDGSTRYFLAISTFVRGPQVEQRDSTGGFPRYKAVAPAELTIWYNNPEQWQAAIDAAKRADEVAAPGARIVGVEAYRRNTTNPDGSEQFGATIRFEAFPWDVFFHPKPRRFEDNLVQFVHPEAEAAYNARYGAQGANLVPPQVLGAQPRAGGGNQALGQGAAPGDTLAADMQGVDLSSIPGLPDGDLGLDLGNLDIDLESADLGDLGVIEDPAATGGAG